MTDGNGTYDSLDLPPQDLEAERSLLAAIFVDPDQIDETAGTVRESDFYAESHRLIYAAMWSVREAGEGVHPVQVGERLERDGKLEQVGGAAGLADIMDSVGHGMYADYYARRVSAASQRRTLHKVGREATKAAKDPAETVDESVPRIEQSLHGVLEQQANQGGATLREILLESFDELREAQHRTVTTGYPDIDNATGGMGEGSLILLAARPSMGKTSLAHCLSLNVGRDRGGVLFISLEQPRLELTSRMLSTESGIPSRRFSPHALDRWENDALLQAASRLQDVPVFIDDDSAHTVSRMAALARLRKRRHGLAMVVVDYLQLIRPDDRREPREQQVAGISRQLKGLAKDLDVPVLCLAQLNRQVEQREDRKPRLSDLRESGALEQDADQVWFLWRPAEYALERVAGEPYPPSHVELIVSKNRNGETHKGIELHWDSETTTFRLAARGQTISDEYQV